MTQGLPAVIAVGVGGALGALARFGVSQMVAALTRLPLWSATMATNILGCFAIGLAYRWAEGQAEGGAEGGGQPEWVYALLITGLLGAFTTFSTFSLEVIHLIDDRRWGQAVLSVGGSMVIGLIAVKVGMIIAGELA